MEGDALAASLNGFPGGVERLGGEGAIELKVQMKARNPKGVGEDEFDLESRGLDTAGFEKGGAALDHLEKTHRRQLSLAGPRRQT